MCQDTRHILPNCLTLSRSSWPKLLLSYAIRLIPCTDLSTISSWYEVITKQLANSKVSRSLDSFQVKPAMDVMQVPEFLQLLHSTDVSIQRTQQRTFILNLIRDGIRCPRDYLVCAQRRVFRLLLSLQPSVLLADESTKVTLPFTIMTSMEI